MQEVIKKILEVAVHAPSGENAQPWRFEVSENRISIFNIPERDQSLYNHNQLGSLVAHGALIENIIIAATAHSCSAALQLFPDKQNQNHVAILEIQKTNVGADPLHAYIEKRCTNRKPYKKNTPLSKEQVRALEQAQETAPGGRVVFTQDKEHMRILARAGSINEHVMFDNRFLHNFFTTHVTWTKEEDDKKRLGFYIKTLEMPPPAELMMRLFLKRWPVMRALNTLGMASMIARTNAGVYASSSAIGAVVMPGSKLEDFINAGRIMQRTWLTATKLGLSIQPMTGVLFFMQGIQAGKTELFLPHHLELIKSAHQDIYRTFGVSGRDTVSMMFRIGYGGAPTARASKLPPEIQ